MFNPESDPLGAALQQLGKISIALGETVSRMITARVYSAVWYLSKKGIRYLLWLRTVGFSWCNVIILILIVLLLLRTMNAARKSCDDLGTYMFWIFAMI